MKEITKDTCLEQKKNQPLKFINNSNKGNGKELRLCTVNFLYNKAFETPLSNLIKVLSSCTNLTNVIIANVGKKPFKSNKNRIHVNEIHYKRATNAFIEFVKYLFLQARISLILAKQSKNIDVFVFFMEGVGLFPMLTARLLRKKVVWVVPSSILMKSTEINKKSLHGVFLQLQTISSVLSDKIIVYSPNLIKEWNLERFRDKIHIAHEHFLDFKRFKVTKKYDKRKNLVGHIGRLSGEKGTLNFVRAIPKISEDPNTEFLIGGDGKLTEEIKVYLDKNKLRKKVNLVGWIPHEQLPKYLNELKLIVLSSYTEGLPNVVLEAMACGTPVLATSVGGIPDIVKNNETGFILENNSPECIEKNILEALNNSKLMKISGNARQLIEKDFTYENAVEIYGKILGEFTE